MTNDEGPARERAAPVEGSSSPLAPRPSPLGALRRWGLQLVGVALFIWVLRSVGPANVWRALRAADPWPIVPAVLVVLPFIYVKGWRWARILAGLGDTLPLGAACRYYAIGMFAGQATPGQAGDFVKAWYLRSRGVPLAHALLSSLLDRLFDLAVIFALGAVAILFTVANDARSVALVVAALLVVCAALAAAMTARWRAPLLALLARLTPGPLRARLAGNELLRSLADAQLDARHLAPVLGLTAVAWVMTLGRVYLCFRAVGVSLELFDYLLVAVLILLASLISIGGIGTRDAVLLALLSARHYDRGQAEAISLLILVLNVSNIVPGFLIWLREPLPLRRAAAMGAPGEDGRDEPMTRDEPELLRQASDR
jgi:glycosyltransferase 2 family protein